jgi:hypothetical protein
MGGTERGGVATFRQFLRGLDVAKGHVPPVLVQVSSADIDLSLVDYTQTLRSAPPDHLPDELGESQFLVLPTAEKSGTIVRLAIGRSRDCDVRISGASVSKHHATMVIDRLNGEFFLHDEQSHNGTFVDGTRLDPGARLRVWSGSRIWFGATMFIFVEPPMIKQLARLS